MSASALFLERQSLLPFSLGEPTCITTGYHIICLENSMDLEQIFKVFRGKIKYLNGIAKLLVGRVPQKSL